MSLTKSETNSRPYSWQRFWFAFLLIGRVVLRFILGKTCWHKIPEYLFQTGPEVLVPVIMVNLLGGTIFTIQTARQLERLGALNSLGGAFAIAFCRELAPILTASAIAGQIGSAYAAEIGSMKISEQIDALYSLRTEPIDYLILPRTIACCLMMPIVNMFSLLFGIFGGLFAATQLYKISPLVFLESVRTVLNSHDLIDLCLKGLSFGIAIATIGCGWGLTTNGGVKQVGESATAAVVIAGVAIFAIDLFISLLLGDARIR
jgi:phospholipid/cholesterol/gamma-HCH transport system permease protein